MSWLSKAVHGLGGLAEKAAPYVGLIPGVGTIAGGAIGGLGALAHGDGLGGALKYGALGAAGGFGGAALRGSSLGAKALAVGSAAMHGGAPSVSGGGAMSEDPSGGVNLDPNTGLEDMNAGDSGGVGGWLRKAAGAITGGPGQTNPLMMGLAGAEGINSAYLGNKANNYASDALKTTQDSYNSRAGLRSAGIEGLLHPTAPDMSAMSSIQSRNPYSAPAAPTPPPAAPSPSGFLATRIKQAA